LAAIQDPDSIQRVLRSLGLSGEVRRWCTNPGVVHAGCRYGVSPTL
jgi:hypothetical protein